MSDDNTFLSADEAFEAFKPQFDKLVEDKISQKSGRLAALSILDRMDETAQTLGLPQIDKVKVATFMKENGEFDPDAAVRAVYSGNTEKPTVSTPATTTPSVVPTKDNLQSLVHQAIGGDDADFSPESVIESLRSQLLGGSK